MPSGTLDHLAEILPQTAAMTQFGRRLVPPGESLRKAKKAPATPDVEQVKGWFDEARASDAVVPTEPLTTRVARMLGLRRDR